MHTSGTEVEYGVAMMAASWFPTLTYQDFLWKDLGWTRLGVIGEPPPPGGLSTPSVSATASQGSGPDTKIKKLIQK